MLHDDRARAEIGERVRKLTRDSPRKWGRMTIDQMVWHVNQGLLSGLGQLQMERKPVPLALLVKPLVLNVPWPRGAPTAREYLATSSHDFLREQDRCLSLVSDFARRALDDAWPVHFGLGPLTGQEWSRLQYKHLDHHLRQFSA